MKRVWNVLSLCAMTLATGLSRGGEVEWRPVGTPSKPKTVTNSVKLAQHSDPPLPSSPDPIKAFPTPAPASPGQIEIASPSTGSDVKPQPEIIGQPKTIGEAYQKYVGPIVGSCLPDFSCDPCPVEGGYVVGPTRFFVRGEFLAWWTRSAGGPPLLTTTTAAFPTPGPGGTVPISSLGNIGALGAPGTQVLLSSKDLDTQFRPGLRLAFGYWFDECGARGIDGSIFFTGRQSQRYDANSNQFATLFRPFFAADPRPDLGDQPGQFREIVGATSLGINGQFAAENRSVFWGADLNYRRCLWRDCTLAADAFVGFRYLNLDEELNIYENILATQTLNFTNAAGAVVSTLPAGSRFIVTDRFDTRNDFYGGQVGVDAVWQRDRWSLNVRPSVALGVTHQQVIIQGASTAIIPGVGVQNSVGGLYALNSNIGSQTSNPFTVVPELQLKVGYQLTERLRLTVGYDFLYWSSVVRPADQIDFVLDTNRLPPPQPPVVNPPRPAPVFEQTDFWAMGFNTGLEYRW